MAAEALESALALREGASAHYELAKAYLVLGRRQEAVQHLENATRIDPTFTEALYRLGHVWSRLGELTRAGEAFERFEKWREAARRDPEIWRQVGYHKQALASDPGSDRHHYALGRIYARQGWMEAAAGELQLAVEANPGFHDAWQQLGALYLRERRAGEAAEVFERIVERWPHQAGAWNNLCGSYMAAGRLDDAHRAFQRALSLAPRSASLHYNLGNLHRMRGELSQALTAYRRALSYEPDNDRIRDAVGKLAQSLAEPGD